MLVCVFFFAVINTFKKQLKGGRLRQIKKTLLGFLIVQDEFTGTDLFLVASDWLGLVSTFTFLYPQRSVVLSHTSFVPSLNVTRYCCCRSIFEFA